MKTTIAIFSVVKIRENNAAEGTDPLHGIALIQCMSYTAIGSPIELPVYRKDDKEDGEWMVRIFGKERAFGTEIPISLGQNVSLVLEPFESK